MQEKVSWRDSFNHVCARPPKACTQVWTRVAAERFKYLKAQRNLGEFGWHVVLVGQIYHRCAK
jgi:hypothetical protein